MGPFGCLVENLTTPELRRSWAKKASEHVPWLSVVAFYAVLANIAYWIVSREFSFSRLGWFCIQYAVVGLLALIVPRLLAAALLFFVISADLVCGVCMSYYLPIGQCLANVSVAHALSGRRLLCAIAAVLLALLTVLTAALLPARALQAKQRLMAALCLLVFATTILAVDCLSIRLATGHMPVLLGARAADDGVDWRLISTRLVRIPIIRLARMEMNDAKIRAWEKNGAASQTPVPSAAAIALRAAGITAGGGNHELPNVVLILVESWGLASDSPLNDSLVAPYVQPDVMARYAVVQGKVPYYGSTIPGEARELCGSGFGFRLLVAPAGDLQSCLPARLASLGYHDLAAHGMSEHMFNRKVWYKAIGFQERWFHDQFKQDGLPDCMGIFIGTCDADIAAWIGRRLEEPNPRPYFIHWMTLNSHLPVPVPSQLSDGAPCSLALSLTPNSPLCSWYQLVANVHSSVARLAMGPLARSTVFVIVGDHAPPFGDPVLRRRFSQTDVPYLILLPRMAHISNSEVMARNSVTPFRKPAKSPSQIP